jgi:hypothetical protein
VSEDVGNLVLPPRQNNLRTFVREAIEFRLKYESAEGWLAYSPLLQLHPDGVEVSWERE